MNKKISIITIVCCACVFFLCSCTLHDSTKIMDSFIEPSFEDAVDGLDMSVTTEAYIVWEGVPEEHIEEAKQVLDWFSSHEFYDIINIFYSGDEWDRTGYESVRFRILEENWNLGEVYVYSSEKPEGINSLGIFVYDSQPYEPGELGILDIDVWYDEYSNALDGYAPYEDSYYYADEDYYQIPYDDLLRYQEVYTGIKVVFPNVTVLSVSKENYLIGIVPRAGKSYGYLFIDISACHNERVLTEDTLTVYGIFNGVMDEELSAQIVGNYELPMMNADYFYIDNIQ